MPNKPEPAQRFPALFAHMNARRQRERAVKTWLALAAAVVVALVGYHMLHDLPARMAATAAQAATMRGW